jgi:DHA1 family bicyclomycin/chloramphenicol resistance-like MFS transporter
MTRWTPPPWTGSEPAVGEGRGAATVVRRRWVLVVVLGALSTFGPLSMDMYLPSLPTIATDLQAGTSTVQLSLTACVAGLALGQLVAGPLSDSLGRRRPLLFGLAGFVVASVLCAFSPSIHVLLALRLVQGLCGATGLVIARAIVRDLHSGVAAARFFSRLMLVSGLAPILAPLVGGQLLRVTTWRGVFVFLALVGAFIFLAALFGAPETRPAGSRRPQGLGGTAATFGRLLRDPHLIGYALAGGLGFATLFAYISGSSFVIQDIYGASPQLFSAVFAANALGLALLGQVNGLLVGRFSPRRLMTVGLLLNGAAALAVLAGVAANLHGLAPLLVPLFCVVCSQGLIMPNSIALAMQSHPEAAGTASALLGAIQFTLGAIVAPLVGLGGSHTALPMAVVMAVAAVMAVAVMAVMALAARRKRRPAI